MILHLSPNAGGIVELHIHEGAHVSFEGAEHNSPPPRLADPMQSVKPKEPGRGRRLSRVLLPIVTGLAFAVFGVFVLSQSGVARNPVAKVAQLQLDPVPLPYTGPSVNAAPQQTSVSRYVPGSVPQADNRADDNGPTALPPAIALQLAQPAHVTMGSKPSAVPQKQAGSAFGLED